MLKFLFKVIGKVVIGMILLFGYNILFHIENKLLSIIIERKIINENWFI